jgi:2-phosphosulfolactate phosphatase
LPRKQRIEVCFTPAVYHKFHNNETNVVVVDILRATSAICTAFMNGVKSIIPVSTIEEALKYKQQGFLVAAERDGIVLDFADFGNSPYNFTAERVKGKTIVYSTTNGTQAVNMAKEANKIIIGSFLNLQSITNFLASDGHDVVVFCSGWKDRFSLEDSIFAGALVESLINTNHFETICDSSLAAGDLWSIAKTDLVTYLQKAAQRSRLKKNNLDDVIEYCLTPNQTDIIPIYYTGSLISLDNCENDNIFIQRKIKLKI